MRRAWSGSHALRIPAQGVPLNRNPAQGVLPPCAPAGLYSGGQDELTLSRLFPRVTTVLFSVEDPGEMTALTLLLIPIDIRTAQRVRRAEIVAIVKEG